MKKFIVFISGLLFFLIVHCIPIRSPRRVIGTSLRSAFLFLIVHYFPIRRMWLIGISTAIAVSTFNIEHCEAQWLQITLPVSGGVYHMQFINSNTGWAVISQTNVGYILIRTTNQGTNWSVIYSDSSKVGKFQFINDTLGYSMGYWQGYHIISKTTNGGYNWTVMRSTFSDVYDGFYMINADTGWVNAFSIPTTITLRTTNGFQTLEQISTGGGGTPAILYFFKEKYNGEYCGYVLGAGILSKTTNSGYNWEQINIGTSGNVNSFSFINKDTGWIVLYAPVTEILRTNDGGINWIVQYYHNNSYSGPSYIQAITYNKIWSGMGSNDILTSTNGGIIWGKQSCQITSPANIYLYDTSLGFAWNVYSINNFARTTNGGGPITTIDKISKSIPIIFNLKQNYPNPFNSSTTIEFELSKKSSVSILIFDILGREITKLVYNKELSSGTYSVTLNMNNFNLSSGIYLYKFTAIEKESDKVIQISKKMIYSK
jgi:photosystem II stability/assembly factor-like uncharacterized protein